MMSSPNRDFSLQDSIHSFRRRTAGLTAFAALLLACGTASSPMPAAAASVAEMLSATPLVLKDGRIAEVSVHTVPFPSDAVAPASQVKNALDAFTSGIATDCFLTAQVIGHVDKSEIGGRETADIHRLARARADTIQASLIENGLPPASIASVWDWRFMVQKPRATLWVFSLTAGDDCEDIPLGIPAADQIAEAPPAPETPARDATVVAKSETPSSVVEHHIIPAAKPKAPKADAPVPGVPAVAAAAATPNATATSAAGKTEHADRSRIAALSQSQDAGGSGSGQPVDSGVLEIVFATNSSYFPEGAGDQLRAFMKTLDKNASYVLRIATSVDGHASVSGASSSDEAQRYNAWLAERRFKRVETWLLKNGDGRELKLEPSLIENDGSRRVRIEANPLG